MDQKYNKLVVYYFTGTGNARNCALWFCEKAAEYGIKTEIHDISKISVKDIQIPAAGTLIGFCSPTHGFDFPQIMRKFIRRFPASAGADAFVLNTRAGVRLFKLVIPGLSGILHYISYILLTIKGYKVVGLIPVDLPSNWISLHPAIEKKGVEIIYKKQKFKVTGYAEKILNGKSVYRALYDLIQDALISPVALAYLFIGRVFLSKSYFTSRECNRCMLCLKECPVGAIKLVDGRMFWTTKCENCMHCMNICPRKAIETPHGLIFVLFYLCSIAMTALTAYFTAGPFPAGVYIWLNNGAVRFTLLSLIVLPFYFLAYRIVHYLMRFKPFERIMTLTSLTHLKYWGRYSAPKKF